MLTFTAYSIIPRKIGQHILKKRRTVHLNHLFLTEGACSAKNEPVALFKSTSGTIHMLFLVLSDSNKKI